MSGHEDPIVADYHILTYHEHRLTKFVSDEGDVVHQATLVTSPSARVNVLDVYPTGDDEGTYTARVTITEGALRTQDGTIVPNGYLLELKARKELADSIIDTSKGDPK